VTAVEGAFGDCLAVPVLVGRPTKQRSLDVMIMPSLVSLRSTCTHRTIPLLAAWVSCLRARSTRRWRCRSAHVRHAKKSKRKASAPAAAAPAGDIEAQIKALGDKIRTLKDKLKGEGLSGREANEHPNVQKLVPKLLLLKKQAEVEKLKHEKMKALEVAATELAIPVRTPATSRSRVSWIDADHEGEFSVDLGTAGHQIAEDTLAAVEMALRTATAEQKQGSASASEEVQADGTATRGDNIAPVQAEGGDTEDALQTLNMLQAELRDLGLSEEAIEDDADIQFLQGCLQDLGEPTVGDKVIPWDLPQQHKTRKVALKEWYHRKYQRRTGQLGQHYFNKLQGKSGTKKNRIMKDFILAKRRSLKKKKRTHEPSYFVDEIPPTTEFDGE